VLEHGKGSLAARSMMPVTVGRCLDPPMQGMDGLDAWGAATGISNPRDFGTAEHHWSLETVWQGVDRGDRGGYFAAAMEVAVKGAGGRGSMEDRR
jgi:hypothetical protein